MVYVLCLFYERVTVQRLSRVPEEALTLEQCWDGQEIVETFEVELNVFCSMKWP